MTVEQIAQSYYDAWQKKGADFAGVPLADDFEFTGPVASFTNADDYRQMASVRAAEVLEIADGKIVRDELFYDGEELRKAMGDT